MSNDPGLPLNSSPRRTHVPFSRRKVFSAVALFLILILVLWVIRGDGIGLQRGSSTPASTLVSTNPALLNPGPATFALILMSMGDVPAAKILIKSILIHNTLPSTFHIFCSPDVSKSLQAPLHLISRPRHETRIIFYHLSWPSMRARIEREGNLYTDDQALPSVMKLFLHELLPSSTKYAIYIDPTALFISDPAALWRETMRLVPPAAPAASLYYDQQSKAGRAHVLLLNLEKLREVRLMDSNVFRKVDHAANGAISSSAFRVALGPPTRADGRYDVRAMGGDEVFWRALVVYRPDLFRVLDEGYVVEGCSRKQTAGLGSADVSVEGSITPRLVHFDCVKSRPYTEWRGWDDPDALVNRRWGDAFRYLAGYKWLWLNGGETEAAGSLRLHVIKEGVIFGDERYAMLHRPQ
ncbi:hypothetical protein HDZ31DRAFT_30561 [Schizophyllum fasciatum]